MGALLFGIAGAVILNLQMRMMYGLQVLAHPNNTYASVSKLIEHGELEQANSRLNIRAFHDRQTGKWYACMNKQPYHLWFSRALETCNPLFKADMPAGWEDPWKERYMLNEQGQLVGKKDYSNEQ